MNINLDFQEIKLHSIYTHGLLLVLLEEDWWKTILNIQKRLLKFSPTSSQIKCTLRGLLIAPEKDYKFIIESVYDLHKAFCIHFYIKEIPEVFFVQP